jgi:hypothetical protein
LTGAPPLEVSLVVPAVGAVPALEPSLPTSWLLPEQPPTGSASNISPIPHVFAMLLTVASDEDSAFTEINGKARRFRSISLGQRRN